MLRLPYTAVVKCRSMALSAATSISIGTFAPRSMLAATRNLAIRPTRPLLDVIDVPVPTMGDSITEGTIIEWTAQLGQLVKEGDVVAIVETDKVTIDIKAEKDGVVVKQFGDVDDEIEVGAKLYRIDTEATELEVGFFEVADSSSNEDPSSEVGGGVASSSAESAVAASDAAEKGTASVSPMVGHTRVPSIHFLGKAGWENKLAAPAQSPGDGAMDLGPIGPMYGRPLISEKEIEALMMGGAEEAPTLFSPSGAATFGY